MNLTDLKSRLRAQPDHRVTLILPDGRPVPAQFHVTEVGHVTKQFIDCGGTFRASEAVVLQTWIGRDADHRLTAGRLAHILGLAQRILPAHEVPVEVEYEDGVISQFPLVDTSVEGPELRLQLSLKHTDCLAKQQCGTRDDESEPEGCCSGAAAGQACC